MKKLAWLVALWLVLLFAGMALNREHKQLLSPSGPATRDKGDILLDVFGEFRTVLARYLWFKTDLFHEALEVEGLQVEKQTELIPLMRMVSLLDPRMIEAYDSIAYDLSREHAAQALQLLDEGVARNPASYQLVFRRALLRFQSSHYEAAIEDASQALSLSDAEFDQLNAARLLHWSAKKVGNREAMLVALERLLSLRPEEPLWRQERAALGP